MKAGRILRWIIVALAVAGIGIQLVPVDRTNPPATAALAADPAVLDVLRESCYDCHSNETVWPWYSYVAPVSWLVANDVREGREHINFSEWERSTTGDQAHAAEEILDEIEEGGMPLPNYLRLHPEAVLSAEDRRVLAQWAGAIGGGERTGVHGRGRGESGSREMEDESEHEHDDD